MTITLTVELEERLRDRAALTGQDINELASDLLSNALSHPDNLSEEAVAEIRYGIWKGLEAAKAGRERPLNDYIAEVTSRHLARTDESA